MKLPKHRKSKVWRDEDGDWIWICRGCFAVGSLVGEDYEAVFNAAYRHASTHAGVGFRGKAA